MPEGPTNKRPRRTTNKNAGRLPADDPERVGTPRKLGREVPSAPEQEAAVLGACIQEGRSWWAHVTRLVGRDPTEIGLFWERSHVVVANAIARSVQDGHLSLESVLDQLNTSGEADLLEPDARTFLVNLAATSTLAEVQDLSDVVSVLIGKQRLRAIQSGVESTLGEIVAGRSDVTSIAGDLMRLAGDNLWTGTVPRLGDVVARLQEEDALGVPWRIPTGIEKLDELYRGGHEPGRLYVVGARPKVGKTTLLITEALEALRHGAAVLFVSMEMTDRELWSKMLSSQATISHDEVVRYLEGKVDGLDEEDLEEIRQAELELKSSDLFITFTRDMTDGVDSLLAAIATVKSRLTPEQPLIVFLDYLQLLSRDPWNKVAEVSDITRRCKLACTDMGITIVVASQISRAGAEAEHGMPGPHHLRDSGTIEQDADAVLLLNRPAIQDESKPAHLIDMWLALSRFGNSGYIAAHWLPEYQLIKDLELDDDWESEGPEVGSTAPKTAQRGRSKRPSSGRSFGEDDDI